MNVPGTYRDCEYKCECAAGATGGAVSRLLCTGNVNASSFSNDAAEHGAGINLVRSRTNYVTDNSFTGEQVCIHTI